VFLTEEQIFLIKEMPSAGKALRKMVGMLNVLRCKTSTSLPVKAVEATKGKF
jgi:hypothetical protein